MTQRRAELVEAAVRLFTRKGYHPTTTREIAREAGWSIGAVYEYVKEKEDILYLVCDSIHREMETAMGMDPGVELSGRVSLRRAMEGYFRTCDRMQASILLIYQETKSLSAESRRCVLANDARIARIFEGLLKKGEEDGSLRLDGPGGRALMAHTIVVTGHMWAFRRWALIGTCSLDAYIAAQTELLLGRMTPASDAKVKQSALRRDDALAILRAHKDELRKLGVTRLLLFGSVARDEARPDSDVDLLVGFEGRYSLLDLGAVLELLEGCFGGRTVDVVPIGRERPQLRASIWKDALDVAQAS